MNREQRGLPVGTARIMRRWNTPVNRLYENSSREHTIPIESRCVPAHLTTGDAVLKSYP
jgi:hypothetical protein